MATINVFRNMTLPPRDEEPAYRGLARAIRERIQAGQLRPGDQLPTKREVADALHLSIHTVQHAYNLLVREMLLVGGQGVRTVVAGTRGRRGSALEISPGPNGHGPQHRLTGIVRALVPDPHGVRIELELLDGQSLTVSTSRAAVDWLQLVPSRPATISIEDDALHLTRPDRAPAQ